VLIFFLIAICLEEPLSNNSQTLVPLERRFERLHYADVYFILGKARYRAYQDAEILISPLCVYTLELTESRRGSTIPDCTTTACCWVCMLDIIWNAVEDEYLTVIMYLLCSIPMRFSGKTSQMIHN